MASFKNFATVLIVFLLFQLQVKNGFTAIFNAKRTSVGPCDDCVCPIENSPLCALTNERKLEFTTFQGQCEFACTAICNMNEPLVKFVYCGACDKRKLKKVGEPVDPAELFCLFNGDAGSSKSLLQPPQVGKEGGANKQKSPPLPKEDGGNGTTSSGEDMSNQLLPPTEQPNMMLSKNDAIIANRESTTEIVVSKPENGNLSFIVGHIEKKSVDLNLGEENKNGSETVMVKPRRISILEILASLGQVRGQKNGSGN